VTVWGVDPAARKLALFGINGEHHQVHIITTPKLGRGNELTRMRYQLEKLLGAEADPIVFCEEPVVAGVRNLRSTILLAQTVGMVLALDVPVYLVPVSTWKKDTTGRGNADKSGVSEWLRLEYEQYFLSCDGNQDAVDAAAIAIHGINVLHRSTVDSGSRSHL